MTTPNAALLIHHCLRVILALLFVFAGIAKLADIGHFAHSLGEFGIVFDDLVVPTAWTISLLELVTGLALAVNIRGSLSLLLVLLVVFLGVLSYGIGLGLDIDCGCLGPGYHVGLKTQWIVDFGLVAWCGVVRWTGQKCGATPTSITAIVSRLAGQRNESDEKPL